MKILEKFKYNEYQEFVIPKWSFYKNKYKYCYILETVYG